MKLTDEFKELRNLPEMTHTSRDPILAAPFSLDKSAANKEDEKSPFNS